ncbi:MAG: YdcF family protein [Chromatiales bacterium]|nr:YdcF family protein [Chromatiales bacterium]
MLLTVLIVAALALAARYWLLPAMGRWLVEDQTPTSADAIVVLATGEEYYPRAIEAARLHGLGHAPRVIVNGDRRTPALQALEAQGYRPLAPWPLEITGLYGFLGVPAPALTAVALPQAFDTVSEAQGLTAALQAEGPLPRRILLVTSRFHTHRAATIWRERIGAQTEIIPVAAKEDPFDPEHWWADARQIRWVMAEYGGWLSLLWRGLND